MWKVQMILFMIICILFNSYYSWTYSTVENFDELNYDPNFECEIDENGCVYENQPFSFGLYFHSMSLLNYNFPIVLNDPNWVHTYKLEGHTAGTFYKSKEMHRLASNPMISTICEIGFNTGYSVVNFLTANNQATIFSFDLFVHGYAPAAVRILHEMFPTRDLIVIPGDSKNTVPIATKHYLKNKCNLLFIDGGHSAQQLLTDIINMRDAANVTYHIVLIDDIHEPHLRDIWDNLNATYSYLNLKPLYEIHSRQFSDIKYTETVNNTHTIRIKAPSIDITTMGVAKFVF